jgi:hypothetical protein
VESRKAVAGLGLRVHVPRFALHETGLRWTLLFWHSQDANAHAVFVNTPTVSGDEP